jgi:hypothetical protein
MRIAVAALFGAIVIFLWQFVSHMLLPIGEMGFRAPQNESAVLQAASSGLPDSGVYLLPYLAPEKMNDATAVQDWTRRAQKNPFLFVVVNPTNTIGAGMLPELGRQFVINLLGALLVAFVLAGTAWGFGMRVLVAVVFGVFGWLLAGIVIAWWLGRRSARRAVAF